MWFIDWFLSRPDKEEITKQCSCNWKIMTVHLQGCKYWDKINVPENESTTKQ